MPTLAAHYTLKSVRVADDGAVSWNADFYGSDGFHHWEAVWYELRRNSEHSPTAAALLAAATDDAGILAAVRADADRLLAELEDPTNPTGSRGPRTLTL